MQFYCVIPPLNRLELADFGSGYFLLAQHVLDNQEYSDFYKKRVYLKYSILDNGVAEHRQVGADDLIQAVNTISPNEVIAPDVLYDSQATLAATEAFIQLKPNVDRLMAVPQGETFSEWMLCCKQMLDNPAVDTIGLSKFSVPTCFRERTGSNRVSTNRVECVNTLLAKGWLTKPVHLLGMRDPDEYAAYVGIDNVRSTDSCLPVLAGLQDRMFGVDYKEDETGGTPADYFSRDVTNHWATGSLGKVYYNILYLNDVIALTKEKLTPSVRENKENGGKVE